MAGKGKWGRGGQRIQGAVCRGREKHAQGKLARSAAAAYRNTSVMPCCDCSTRSIVDVLEHSAPSDARQRRLKDPVSSSKAPSLRGGLSRAEKHRSRTSLSEQLASLSWQRVRGSSLAGSATTTSQLAIFLAEALYVGRGTLGWLASERALKG